jgi:hypothetical protein
MKNLLAKLNYKDQERIALINAEKSFYNSLNKALKDVTIDKEIDPRCPYGFMLLFVKDVSDVEVLTPIAIHNLMTDGVLWLCYPKKTSKNYASELNRDYGWKVLNEYGFYGVRMVSIDEDWSALRFRSVKFIRSRSDKYAK